MADCVLVTGGHGKVGAKVVEQLRHLGNAVRIGARVPRDRDEIRFDWDDESTFAPALDGVDAIYLTAPTDRVDQLPAMKPLLERAIETVDGPIVLLSASSIPEQGPMMGQVHAWLKRQASQWAVLRPSWFMQNFITQHLRSIRDEGVIYSATGAGRVAFIDAADIAAVAVKALTEPKNIDGELVLTGPRSISYDEVAALVSAASGRPVRHKRLSADEMTVRLVRLGLPQDYASILTDMEVAIAHGNEDRVTPTVTLVTKHAPNSLESFIDKHQRIYI